MAKKQYKIGDTVYFVKHDRTLPLTIVRINKTSATYPYDYVVKSPAGNTFRVTAQEITTEKEST